MQRSTSMRWPLAPERLPPRTRKEAASAKLLDIDRSRKPEAATKFLENCSSGGTACSNAGWHDSSNPENGLRQSSCEVAKWRDRFL
jgi:hypothetical protein